MITLKDLGELPEKQEMLPEEPLVNKINIAIKAQNSKIDQIANIDLAPALKKAGYVKLEEEMLTDKILKRKNIKSEYQQVSILVARWAIQEIIIDNLKSLLKVAK